MTEPQTHYFPRNHFYPILVTSSVGMGTQWNPIMNDAEALGGEPTSWIRLRWNAIHEDGFSQVGGKLEPAKPAIPAVTRTNSV